jgi:hypothetical protein
VLAGVSLAVAGCGGGSGSPAKPTSKPAPPPTLATPGLTAQAAIASGVVASAAGMRIDAARFDHWLRVIVAASAAATKVRPVVPDPPAYARCIAAARTEPRLSGQPASTLRSACAQLDRLDNEQALDFLIKAAWLKAAGRRAGVTPTRAAVAAGLAAEKARQGAAGYARFLARTGQTPSDLALRVETSEIEARLAPGAGGTRRLLAQITAEFRPRTTCAPAFVMPDCSEYTGSGQTSVR